MFQQTMDVPQGSTSNLTEKENLEICMYSKNRISIRETVLLLTGRHELIDLLRATFWSVHAIIFLQQLIHEGQVDARVGGHTVGGDFPQQDTEC